MQGFSAEGPETQEVVTRRIRSALRPICSVEPPNGGAFSGTKGRSKARERATKTLRTEVMNASWQGLAPCMDGSRTRSCRRSLPSGRRLSGTGLIERQQSPLLSGRLVPNRAAALRLAVAAVRWVHTSDGGVKCQRTRVPSFGTRLRLCRTNGEKAKLMAARPHWNVLCYRQRPTASTLTGEPWLPPLGCSDLPTTAARLVSRSAIRR